MEIKKLVEAMNIAENENKAYSFDDTINYKELYDTIKLEQMGTISFKEIEEVLNFLNITDNSTEDEIRSKRNSVVKFYVDFTTPEMPYEERDIVMDQMSAFTGAIDHQLNKMGLLA